jgi:hypothetical protein
MGDRKIAKSGDRKIAKSGDRKIDQKMRIFQVKSVAPDT